MHKKEKSIWDNKKLVKTLKDGGVAVMPTDTIYGVVARAEDEGAVARIYNIRKRSPEKPCVILISGISELKKFSINLSKDLREKVKKIWTDHVDASTNTPPPLSIILDCLEAKLKYLHRGTRALAFRLPHNTQLKAFLRKVGPLVAPSANLEGKNPSRNIAEAKKYFGTKVDMYIDGGEIKGNASRIIKLGKNGLVTVTRM